MSFWLPQPGFGDAVAVVDEHGDALRYAELDGLVDTAAAALRQGPVRGMGLMPASNRRAWLVAYLACLRAGQVPLLMPPALAEPLRRALVETYRPQWIMDDAAGDALPGSGLRMRWLAEHGNEPPPHPQLGLLLSTSGSTGSPRLVRLSPEALKANAQSIVQYLALAPGERAITSLPPHYSYGLSVIHSHLQAGATLVLTDRGVLQPGFWQSMQDHAVNSLAGVPYTYQMLERTGFAQRELPQLRTLTQAGGRLDDRLVRSVHALAQERGWRFHVMYGQTEASPRISHVPPERLGEKIGSIGVAIPGGALEVDDASPELVYRGPNVMLGYAQSRADLALGDVQRGVLRTGELGRRDEDGFFWLTGRMKRFVKLGGNRVGLDEVEQALQQELAVPVSVGGRDDQLVAWIETSDGALADRAGALFKERYGWHHSLYRVQCVEQLPLLPSGKKDYAAMREPHGA